jgi:putative nucleotidyltransferase with HDIG domain
VKSTFTSSGHSSRSNHASQGHTGQQNHKMKIHVSGLQLGMYVCELDRPWLETPFLMQGFLLETLSDIETVQEICEHVFIDEVHDVWIPTEARSVLDAPAKKPKYINKIPARQEHEQIQAFHAETKRLTKTLLDEVRLGNALNIEQVKKTVHDCVDSIIRNPDALMWLSKIKDKDEYTAEHSMNVGILAINFGRHLGRDRDDLEKLGLCGMLHDIGKTRTPIEVLNKEGAFSPDEFAIMRRHAEDGQRILLGNHGVYYGCVDVCHNHHEALDGSGYPRGLKAHAINDFTRIVTICDVYDAITSDRCYKKGRSSLDALKILYEGRGKKFDSRMVVEFIRCIGLYPVGSIVELENNSIGIVVSNNYRDKRLPRVYLIIDEAAQMIEKPFTLDLAKLTREEDLAPYKIRKVLPNGSHGITLQDYVKKGLRLE